jgi:hypothetical protein
MATLCPITVVRGTAIELLGKAVLDEDGLKAQGRWSLAAIKRHLDD